MYEEIAQVGGRRHCQRNGSSTALKLLEDCASKQATPQ
jgi:hypothetical protein